MVALIYFSAFVEGVVSEGIISDTRNASASKMSKNYENFYENLPNICKYDKYNSKNLLYSVQMLKSAYVPLIRL